MGTEVFLMMMARMLLTQAPEVIDWLKELKDGGKTEVTEMDMVNLAGKWTPDAASFFQVPPVEPKV